jgi:hypothetical protein
LSRKKLCWYCKVKSESYDYKGGKCCSLCGSLRGRSDFWPGFKSAALAHGTVMLAFMAGAACAIDTTTCVVLLGLSIACAHHFRRG